MKIFLHLLLVISPGIFVQTIALAQQNQDDSIRVGWIGAITGPTAKWGAYQAALLGVEDVNSKGGINGHLLQVIFEDTACNGKAAVSAFKKLTSIDNVKFILGGHCSPDSLAFASLAEQKKILSIAAITSSPKLSDQGEYIFRLTPVSTKLAELIAPLAYQKLGIKRLAIIHEQTDYVVPVAEKMEATFKKLGGTITSVNAFNPGETDFRSLPVRASQNSSGIYLGVQAPDTALLMMKQKAELGLKQIIFGNEQFASALLSSAHTEDRSVLENVIFAEPVCDLKSPDISAFGEKYKQRYQVEALPFGCYTGEAYDSVQLLANALRRCGESVECVRDELYRIRDYSGASGMISFNLKGDVEKNYLLKKIVGSQIVDLNNEGRSSTVAN